MLAQGSFHRKAFSQLLRHFSQALRLDIPCTARRLIGMDVLARLGFLQLLILLQLAQSCFLEMFWYSFL